MHKRGPPIEKEPRVMWGVEIQVVWGSPKTLDEGARIVRSVRVQGRRVVDFVTRTAMLSSTTR